MVAMHYIQKSKIIVVIIGVMMLSGCSNWRFSGQNPVVEQETVATAEKSGVTVSVKLLSSQESTRILGVNPYAAGYVPLLLGIHNNTSDMLFLRGQSIHAPLVDPNAVARALHYPTGTFTFYLSYLSALFYWPALVPALGAGYYMSQRNKEVDSSIYVTGFGKYDSVDLLPREYTARIFFLHARDITPELRLHLFNTSTNAFIPFLLQFRMLDKPLLSNELTVGKMEEEQVTINDTI